MRKEFRKVVREAFMESLLEVAPDFERSTVKSPLLFGGETVFRWDATPDLVGFVILVPSPTGQQAFTIEIGWSSDGDFPGAPMRPSVILGPDDPLPVDEPSGTVRLGGLHARSDLWWQLPDPAIERPGELSALEKSLEPIDPVTARAMVAEAVQDAIEVLAQSGLAFLNDWIAAAPHRQEDADADHPG